jgi:hypothetical protein
MKEEFKVKLICTDPIHPFKEEGKLSIKHIGRENKVTAGEAKIRSPNTDINKCIGCRFFEIRTIIDGEELQGKIQPSGNNRVLILEDEKGKTKARLFIRE